MTRTYDWGRVRSFAIETINIDDLFILIGIVKAFQDFVAFTKEGEIREAKPTITLKLGYRFFLSQYLRTHDTDFVNNSLQRLISWKVIFIQRNGDQNPQEYLIDYKIFEEEGIKQIILVLNKNFYNACENKGLLINFEVLKRIKSNLAKALFIYLEGTTAQSFYQKTLEKVLSLDNTNMKPWDRRVKLKEAFEALKKHLLIQNYKCVKKENDHLFTFE